MSPIAICSGLALAVYDLIFLTDEVGGIALGNYGRSLRKSRELIVLIFVVPVLCVCFFRDISNVDELWNYGFANNVVNGLLPYRDFNILQTPFSCLVNSVFLRVFGRHLLVIRLAGALLFFAVSVILYKICRLLGAGKTEALLVPFGFLSMFYWDVFLEYNVLILMFLLMGMLGDVYACHYQRAVVGFKAKRGGKSADVGKNGSTGDIFWIQHVLTGVIMGLAILSKQTYGFFAAAASCLSGMWVEFYLLSRRKPEAPGGKGIKRLFAAFFLRILGIAIPCSLFLFYLIFTGTIGNFWDMCLFGIREFSGIYPYTSFMMENPGYFIGGALFPLLALACVVYMFVNKGEKRAKMGILLLYAVFGCISIYPLANSYHVALSSIPFLPAVFLIFPMSFFAKKPVKILKWIAVLAALVFLIVAAPIINCRGTRPCSLKHYELTFVKNEKQEEIDAVISFINEKENEGIRVYILDNFAQLYFIPLDKYNNGLDMFLLGNLGTKPPKDWIEEVSLPGKTMFLVPQKGRENWQFPYDDMNGKKKDWEFKESIYDLDVYILP